LIYKFLDIKSHKLHRPALTHILSYIFETQTDSITAVLVSIITLNRKLILIETSAVY